MLRNVVSDVLCELKFMLKYISNIILKKLHYGLELTEEDITINCK